jgi:hypothetical protein
MLQYPMGVDQGIFAWFGTVIADGGRPYIDAWDTKGPGVFAIAGALALLSPGGLTLRLFDVLLQLGAAAALYRWLLPERSRLPRLVAPLAYLAGYAMLGYHETVQPDSWATALGVMGFLPALGSLLPSGRARADADAQLPAGPLLLAGAMIGVTATMKPTYAVMGLVPMAMCWWGLATWRGRAVAMAWVCGGGIAVLAVCAAWLGRMHALDDMVDVVVRWNSSVYLGAPAGPRLFAYRVVYGYLGAVPWHYAGLVALVLSLRTWTDGRVRVGVVWGVAALLEVAVQGKFWGYQWTPVLPPTVVMLGASLALLSRDDFGLAPGAGQRRLLWNLVTVAVATTMLGPLLTRIWMEREALTVGNRGGWTPPGYDVQLAGIDSVAQEVAKETRRTDVVYFFGSHAIGNYLASRPSVGRLALSRPILDGDGSPLRQAYRDEFWSAWRVHPPAVVVAYTPEHCRSDVNVQWMCADAYPAFADTLTRQYRLTRRIGAFNIFERQ